MNYNEIIQKPGKEINPKVYYYNNGEKVYKDRDNFVQAKISFNSNVLGSVMKGLELELYTTLPNTGIYLEIEAKYNDIVTSKTYGPYYRKEEPTFNADSKTYTYILYDSILKLMVDYSPVNITYPTTVLEFLKKMLQETGYTCNITSLPNGNRVMNHDVYEGINYTYRDVLDDIGQATATLFKVDGNEVKRCEFSKDAPIVIDDDILKNKNISMGEHFGAINVIVLSRAADSDNIYYPEVLPENPIEFRISENQLMNGNNRDEYLQELYQALNGLEYDVYDCELTGYGGFEPLQKIQIKTLKGDTEKVYNSYAFNNEITITQGYEENIYTELPSESVTDYKVADTTDKRIDNVSLIVDKQQKEIKALAESTVIISNTTIGYEKVELTNIAQNGLHELKLSGELHATIVNDNLVVSENTYILDFVLNIYKNNELVKSYPLPIKDLYVLDDIRDEFIWLDGKMSILHKIGISESGDKYKLSNPYYEELGDLEILNERGDIQISFDYMPSARIEATYLLNNEYTNRFATVAELQGEINVRANEINILNKAKVGGDEIIASINTAIKNKQGIVVLTGNQVIINSDNFQLMPNGNIKSTGGTMAGWNIENNNLSCEIKPPYDYAIGDIERIKNIMLGTMTPTASDYEKYDFNNNRIIDSYDLLIVQKLIDYNLGKSAPGKLMLDTDDWFFPIKIINSLGEKIASFGPNGAFPKDEQVAANIERLAERVDELENKVGI